MPVQDIPTDSDGSMDALPTDSRQPPDGDEFPDYNEATPVEDYAERRDRLQLKSSVPGSYSGLWRKSDCALLLYGDQQSSYSVRDKIAIFSHHSDSPTANLKKTYKSYGDLSAISDKSNISNSKVLSKSVMSVNNTNSSSNVPLSEFSVESDCSSKKADDVLKSDAVLASRSRSSIDLSDVNTDFLSRQVVSEVPDESQLSKRLHTRSMSLTDISSPSDRFRRDRWGLLADQRQNKLSKLKGLVIPEHTSENEPVVEDLPEIKSNEVLSPITVADFSKPIHSSSSVYRNNRTPSVSSLTDLNWNSGLFSTIPKYSPAFKRKSLQLFATPKKTENDQEINTFTPIVKADKYDQEGSTDSSLAFFDAPKSLESITSPTRSDYSFEYISNAQENKLPSRDQFSKSTTKSKNYKEHAVRLEDDSDNDSAVSSSQSSYISKNSPPSSPYHTQIRFPVRSVSMYETSENRFSSFPRYDSPSHRLLKPQSVEAINRKNILASAKCRSGRDLKMGSPLIQRKFDEDKIVDLEQHERNSSEVSETESNDNFLNNLEVSKSFENNELEILPKNESDPDQECEKKLQNNSNNRVINEKKDENNMVEKKVFKPEAKRRSLDLQNETFSGFRAVLKQSEKARSPKVPLEPNYQLKSFSKNTKTSVNDLKNSFEKLASDISSKRTRPPSVPIRRSSLELTTVTPLIIPKVESNSNGFLPINNPQPDVKSLRESSRKNVSSEPPPPETKPSEDEDNIQTVLLKPEMVGGSIGITLAGGSDYETKDVTVYKVRYGSPAYREGTLQKGDEIISINGRSTKGLTHEEAVSSLKEPVSEIVLEIRKNKREQGTAFSESSPQKHGYSGSNSPQKPTKDSPHESKNGAAREVILVKDEAGLGFSLEGGRGSPQGDMPLSIKKVFKGGTADKSGDLQVGDRLLAVNNIDVTTMSRFEAWNLMKKIPEGVEIKLNLQR